MKKHPVNKRLFDVFKAGDIVRIISVAKMFPPMIVIRQDNDAGITISSIWCAHNALKEGTLVQILKDYPMDSNAAIWAVYPSSRLLAPKVRAFIDFFIKYYGEIPYWETA